MFKINKKRYNKKRIIVGFGQKLNLYAQKGGNKNGKRQKRRC